VLIMRKRKNERYSKEVPLFSLDWSFMGHHRRSPLWLGP